MITANFFNIDRRQIETVADIADVHTLLLKVKIMAWVFWVSDQCQKR